MTVKKPLCKQKYMTKIQHKINTSLRPKKPLLVNTREFVRKNKQETILKAFKHLLRTTLEKIHKIGKMILTIEEEKSDKKDFFNHQYCGLPNAHKIKIVKANKGQFMYQGLASCSMIWRCPICSIKILAGRQKEISHLLEHHVKAGYKIGFLTLTMRHKKLDAFEYTLNKLNDTYRKIRNQKEFKHLTKQDLFLGQIKSLETTYTESNGWHPHIHILYFYKTNDSELITSFQKRLITKWAQITNSQVKRQDQSIIETIDEVGQYITKFDIVKEITGDWTKTSKGIKPFQMLEAIASKRIVLGTRTVEESKLLLINLWIEYITTTKGKHRISISPEINYAYKLEAKTDDQLTKQIDVEQIIISMSKEIMMTIIDNEIKADLINICYDHENDLQEQQKQIFDLLQEFEYIQKQILSNGEIHLSINNLN